MLNNIDIMGRLTKEPELKQTANGISVTSFSIAVDRDFSKDTDFFDVVAWRKTAEFITQYFHKGNLIVLSGALQTREWEDKNGNKRKSVEIVAESAYFGGKKEESSAPIVDIPPDDEETEETDENELPF